MTYTIVVTRQAQRAIDRLPITVYPRVRAAIDGLAHEPRPHGAIKLRNLPEWRIRVGDYRIIYTIDDAGHIVIVVAVSHRSNVYR